MRRSARLLNRNPAIFLSLLFSLGILGTLLLLLFAAQQASSQLPSQLKIEDQNYRNYMIKISRQLGITCNTCHNTSHFESPEKIQFKIAKDHMRITQALVDAGFDGKNGRAMADCYMCHRGQLKPDYIEPFDPMTMKKKDHPFSMDSQKENSSNKNGDKSKESSHK